MSVDYGQDLNFLDLDMDETGSMVSGVQMLIQAILIRLSTPRGSVIDAPDDGICLSDYLSRGLTPADVAMLAGTISQEILKDERFTRADAKIDSSNLVSADELSISLDVDSGLGPFQFTLLVNKAGAAVLGDV
jgi:hypothetical protein